MKRFSSLGAFLLNSALIAAVSRDVGRDVMFISDPRDLRDDMSPFRMPDFQPRTLSKAEAKEYLSPKQADIDALDRAVAKRQRKAAKLREHGL